MTTKMPVSFGGPTYGGGGAGAPSTPSIEALGFRAYDNAAEVATDIYVATTGNDVTGDGSIGSPFATIPRAIRHVSECTPVGNRTIHVAPGPYNMPSGLVNLPPATRISCAVSVTATYTVQTVLRGGVDGNVVDQIQGAVVTLAGAAFTPNALIGTLIRFPGRNVSTDLGIETMHGIITSNTATNIAFEFNDTVSTSALLTAGVSTVEFLSRDVSLAFTAVDAQGRYYFNINGAGSSLTTTYIEYANLINAGASWYIGTPFRFRFCALALFGSIQPSAQVLLDCTYVVGNITVEPGGTLVMGYGSVLDGGGVFGGILLQPRAVASQFGSWRAIRHAATTPAIRSKGGSYDAYATFVGVTPNNQTFRPLAYSTLLDDTVGASSGNHAFAAVMGAWNADNVTYEIITDTYLCRVRNGTRVNYGGLSVYTYPPSAGLFPKEPSADGGASTCASYSDGTRVSGAYMAPGPQGPTRRTVSGTVALLRLTDQTLDCDNSAATVTVQLPAAASVTPGGAYDVKALSDVTVFDVVFDPDGTDTIEGVAANYGMAADAGIGGAGALTIYSDGVNGWRVR